MDQVRHFLNDLQTSGLATGHFLGLLNILIGRRLTGRDGTQISSGVTWREVAGHLRRLRWDPEIVVELGLDSTTLPPRDRERYWYSAIALTRVDSPQATAAGDRLAEILRERGYGVGLAPGQAPPSDSPPPSSGS